MEELDKDISRSRRVIALYGLLVAGAFAIWFPLVQGASPSETIAEWGQFGDYIGGLLNPVVALFAFYWLTRSVKIQKEELSETKTALQESKQAQERQAETALATAKIQSLNIELTLIATELGSLYSRRNSVMERGIVGNLYNPVMDESGRSVDPREALTVINNSISMLKDQQDELLKRIGEIRSNLK